MLLFVVKIAALLLAFDHVESSNFNELRELVEKIHLESDSATVFCIGFDGDVFERLLSEPQDRSYIPIVHFTSFQHLKRDLSLTNVILLLNVTHVDLENDSSQILWNRLSVRKFVVVFCDGLQILRNNFDYLLEKKFTRIYGIIDNIQYAYFPYMNGDKIVPFDSRYGLLPNSMEHLTNFTFRTTVQTDYPRAFRYIDEQGISRIGGRIGLTFVNFVRRYNATFKEVIINNSTSLFIPGVINATLNDDIDISMNVYGIAKGLDMSYPLMLQGWNIMVPVNGHLDPYEYYQRPFTPAVWKCIALTIIYITVIEVLLNVFTKNLTPNVWPSFSQAFLLVLGQPLQKPINPSYYRIHFQVFLFSFIIGNLYTIHFKSFLTVFINVKQYDTIQDLVDNNVLIMIPDFEVKDLDDFDNYPSGFEKMLVPTEHAVFLEQMNSMCNTKFGFTIGGDRCDFLIRLQSLFVKPLFRKASEPLSEFHLGFLLPKHSPFKEILDRFILEIAETGLMLKWEADAAYQSIKNGHPMRTCRAKEVYTKVGAALTLNHLLFGFYCLAIGLTIGLVVFACELIFGKVLFFKSISIFLTR